MSNQVAFAFSIHKSGSTLFYNFLINIMHRSHSLLLPNSLRYVSVPDQLFGAGISENVLLKDHFLEEYGYAFNEERTLYGGFRFVPKFVTQEFLADKKVMVLVRDPRDVLTSLYFSVQKSHCIPEGEGGEQMSSFRDLVLQQTIDDFVLKQARSSVAAWSERFRRISELKSVGRAWRYEDVVFEKRKWLDEILDYLEIDLPEASRVEFVQAEDVRPDIENASNHIRQVTPGDHARKLKNETIEELNDIFDDVLSAWSY